VLNLTARLLCIAVGITAVRGGARGQILSESGITARPEAGKFLIAAPSSNDPDFARTVILVLHSDRQGIIGLIVNQRTSVPLSGILPNMKSGGGALNPVYKGGPLRMGVNGLLRSRTKPPSASAVFGQIYLISDKSSIVRLAEGTPATSLRVYVGLCGWSPAGQLVDEIRRGIWIIGNADDQTVFDGHPESVWSRLISRIDSQNRR